MKLRRALGGVLVLIGCAEPAPSPQAARAAPVDLATVTLRARHAFHATREGLVAAGARAEGARVALSPALGAGEVGLVTSSVVRAGSPLTQGDRFVPGDDGCVARTFAGGVERACDTPDGVAQSWRFDAPFAGDLDLAVDIDGARFEAETAGGVHLRELRGGGLVRYGHGTWIDARGTRTHVPARFVDGAVRLRVPADLVARSTFPCVLDPVLSPEFGLDAPAPSGAGTGQGGPVAAFDGQNFLVVWGDPRPSRTRNALWGARVSASGAVLDPVGFELVRGGTRVGTPQVGFDGTNFVVAWGDNRNEPLSADAYVARVSTDGRVLDAGGSVASNASGAQSPAAMATSSTLRALVYFDQRGRANRIYATRVDAMGRAMDPAGIPLSVEGAVYDAHAATDGSVVLAAWRQAAGGGNRIHIALLDAAGAVRFDRELTGTASNEQYTPRVGFDGTNFVVAWIDGRAGGVTTQVYAARVSRAGVTLDASGRPVSDAFTHVSLSLAWDGTAWTAATHSAMSGPYAPRAWRFTPALARVGGTLALTALTDASPVLAGSPGATLAMGTDVRDGAGWQSEVWAARISYSGAVLDPMGLRVTAAANMQWRPAVASLGDDFLVVWEDYRRALGPQVFGARVSGAGAVLDPRGILLSDAPSATMPSVDADGSGWFVTWASAGRIEGVRVDRIGARVGTPASLATTTGFVEQPPRVAASATQHLIVWPERPPKMPTRVFARRVDFSGSPTGAAFLVSPAASGAHAQWPAIASDGTDFLVAWGTGDIAAARVSAMGSVLDPMGITVSAAMGAQLRPAASFHAGEYTVAWQDERVTPDADLYAARVSRAGAVSVGERLVAGGASRAAAPALAQGVLAWEGSSGSGLDVLATRLAADLGPGDDAGVLAVATSAEEERAPAVAVNDRGCALYVYERFDPAAPYGIDRARARLECVTALPVTDAAAATDASEDVQRADVVGMQGDVIDVPMADVIDVTDVPSMTDVPSANDVSRVADVPSASEDAGGMSDVPQDAGAAPKPTSGCRCDVARTHRAAGRWSLLAPLALVALAGGRRRGRARRDDRGRVVASFGRRDA